MNSKKRFIPRNEQTTKIMVDEKDCHLEIKINPREYFYPYLTYDPYHMPDYMYDEEDPISEERFEKDKNEYIKVDKMFRDKKYVELFEDKIRKNLESILREMEYEVEYEYEELLPKKASAPKPYFESTETLIDSHFRGNEDAIFEFLKEKGLFFLRNETILSKIQEWYCDRNKDKIKKFERTLREIARTKRGPMPFAEDKAVHIIFLDKLLRKQIKDLREKIELYEKKIRREEILSNKIISEYKEKGHWWLRYLEEIVREKFGIGKTDFVRFIRSTTPRDISIGILAKKYKLSDRTVEEIFRQRKKIRERSKL